MDRSLKPLPDRHHALLSKTARRAAALFCLALGARLVAAATSGLYVDEALNFFISRHDLAQIVAEVRPDANPPLWYLMMHPISLMTHDGFLLRTPAVLLGAFTAPVTYLAGRVLGERTGLWSGALVALSYVSWELDAQVRAYALLTLLAVLSLWTMLDPGPQGRPRIGFAGLAIAAIAMPLLHFTGMLIDIALLLACACPGMPRRNARAACLAGGIACGGAWMIFSALGPPSAFHVGGRGTGLADAVVLPAFLSGLPLPMHWPAFRPFGATDVVTRTLAVVVAVAALFGLTRMLRTHAMQACVLALFLLIPFAGLAIGELLGFGMYQNRYLIPLSSGLFITLAAGLKGARQATSALLALMLAVNVVTLALFPSDSYLQNQDWRSAAAWLEQREERGDVIAAYIPYSFVGLDFYYHAGQIEIDFPTPNTLRMCFREGYDGAEQLSLLPTTLDDALAARLRGRRVFLVLNQCDDASKARLFEWFSRGWQATDAFTRSGLAGWGNMTIIQLSPLQADRSAAPRPPI